MPGYSFNRGVASAIAAALLFGASTPFTKLLLAGSPPVLLAGLLYLGSGLGLGVILAGRALLAPEKAGTWALPRGAEWGWLFAAIAAGGVVGPVLLLEGLAATPASAAALLLNMEGVFTALLAWFAFRENFDRRIALGMALIVLGGVALAWGPDGAAGGSAWGMLAVAGACLAWGLDNNLTRKVSASDAVFIACVKGLVAGAVNLLLALTVMHVSLPDAASVASALGVGLFGYGVSLVLFVIGLRHLGTARTGAYFSVAPFFGAALALYVNAEALTINLMLAGLMMGWGVWLHLTERHEHEHVHEALAHDHAHYHDEHHRHEHDFAWDGREPHRHFHVHAPLRHSHPHFPDIHHRHEH